MRGTGLKLDLPLPESKGSQGVRVGSMNWRLSLSGRRQDGKTVLTCVSLCLLQLQKLLQEAAVIGKFVGNGRVVCIRNSRPKTEDREGKP